MNMDNIILDIAQVNLNLNVKVRKGIEKEFDQIIKISTPYGELGEIIYHLFSAIHVWTNRISDTQFTIPEYKDLTNKELFYNEWIKIDTRFINFAKMYGAKLNYSKQVSYKTKSGNQYETIVKDIIMHMGHHSFYHRGQIALILRLHNLQPLPNLDWNYD